MCSNRTYIKRSILYSLFVPSTNKQRGSSKKYKDMENESVIEN
jgi:hypothetical protein